MVKFDFAALYADVLCIFIGQIYFSSMTSRIRAPDARERVIIKNTLDIIISEFKNEQDVA